MLIWSNHTGAVSCRPSTDDDIGNVVGWRRTIGITRKQLLASEGEPLIFYQRSGWWRRTTGITTAIHISWLVKRTTGIVQATSYQLNILAGEENHWYPTSYQLQAGEGEPQVFYQLPAMSSGSWGEPLVFTSYWLLKENHGHSPATSYQLSVMNHLSLPAINCKRTKLQWLRQNFNIYGGCFKTKPTRLTELSSVCFLTHHNTPRGILQRFLPYTDKFFLRSYTRNEIFQHFLTKKKKNTVYRNFLMCIFNRGNFLLFPTWIE